MKSDAPHANQKTPSLSVVFSFYNEEEVLEELIRRTRKCLDQLQKQSIVRSYELIFVNDASTDSSLQILLNHAKDKNDIRILNMSRRFGVSPCVMAGFAYSSGDWVVYMDSDLQDPPEVIPELINVAREKNVDVVHTVRKTRKGESPSKLWLTKLGYFILNKTSSVELPVEAGDFKLLSRRVVNHLLQLKEAKPFMRGLVRWVGFKQEFVPYEREARQAGKTKFHVLSKGVISNFFNSALISFSSAPLRVAYFFGIIALIFVFILVGHVGVEKLSGRAIPGWTAIMIAILFLGGIQLFCMGMMGLYIHSVFEQTKERPNYIVESTVGFTHDSSSPIKEQSNEKFIQSS